MTSEGAWVTLATNDTYCLGALVLGYSLRRVQTRHQLAVIITPQVTPKMREALSHVYDLIHVVDVLDSKDATNLALLKRPDLGVTFTKIHCWNLTQFSKGVFIDADTLVLQNCDELFEREELSAAPDPGWPDCFNSGVFVFRPSNETFQKLIDFATKNGSFDGGDQGLLNMYFSDWATKDIKSHLSFLYNMCSTTTYTYLPALKHYGGNTKIVHFIGSNKPWLQGTSSASLSGFVQTWWDIFHANVASTLTKDMSGLAGAIGSKERAAVEEQWRKQNWEQGNIDYCGIDSFDNIWRKIVMTISKSPSASTPKAPGDQTKEQPKEPPLEIKAAPEKPAIPADSKVSETQQKPEVLQKPAATEPLVMPAFPLTSPQQLADFKPDAPTHIQAVNGSALPQTAAPATAPADMMSQAFPLSQTPPALPLFSMADSLPQIPVLSPLFDSKPQTPTDGKTQAEIQPQIPKAESLQQVTSPVLTRQAESKIEAPATVETTVDAVAKESVQAKILPFDSKALPPVLPQTPLNEAKPQSPASPSLPVEPKGETPPQPEVSELAQQASPIQQDVKPQVPPSQPEIPPVDSKPQAPAQPVLPPADSKPQEPAQSVLPPADSKPQPLAQPQTPPANSKPQASAQPVLPPVDSKPQALAQPSIHPDTKTEAPATPQSPPTEIAQKAPLAIDASRASALTSSEIPSSATVQEPTLSPDVLESSDSKKGSDTSFGVLDGKAVDQKNTPAEIPKSPPSLPAKQGKQKNGKQKQEPKVPSPPKDTKASEHKKSQDKSKPEGKQTPPATPPADKKKGPSPPVPPSKAPSSESKPSEVAPPVPCEPVKESETAPIQPQQQSKSRKSPPTKQAAPQPPGKLQKKSQSPPQPITPPSSPPEQTKTESAKNEPEAPATEAITAAPSVTSAVAASPVEPTCHSPLPSNLSISPGAETNLDSKTTQSPAIPAKGTPSLTEDPLLTETQVTPAPAETPATPTVTGPTPPLSPADAGKQLEELQVKLSVEPLVPQNSQSIGSSSVDPPVPPKRNKGGKSNNHGKGNGKGKKK